MERGTILSENGVITAQALPREIAEQEPTSTTNSSFLSLRDIEKRHIQQVMEHAAGNRSQAADLLRISRKTLYRKLKEYGLE
jgi:DNA-binding NtrC family response regulator